MKKKYLKQIFKNHSDCICRISKTEKIPAISEEKFIYLVEEIFKLEYNERLLIWMFRNNIKRKDIAKQINESTQLLNKYIQNNDFPEFVKLELQQMGFDH